MISKEFILEVAHATGIENLQLIEKDLYLQGLLLELSKANYFSENFVFKGGTCLTKAYFGYYRFSEDLDFTWINQSVFEGKSEKQVTKMLSKEVSNVMGLIELSAKTLGLEFKAVKSDSHFVQLGGSNRFATFKLWFKPVTSDVETFIKIQLNFVEKLFYKPKKREVAALAEKHKKELEFLYPSFARLAVENAVFYVYDLKEIAAEKIRALLTRRGFKARDLIDLYILSRNGITIASVRQIAIQKTVFMLKYLKYAENLKNKAFDEEFKLGDEQKLVVKNVDAGFEGFAKNSLKELNALAAELKTNFREASAT